MAKSSTGDKRTLAEGSVDSTDCGGDPLTDVELEHFDSLKFRKKP